MVRIIWLRIMSSLELVILLWLCLCILQRKYRTALGQSTLIWHILRPKTTSFWMKIGVWPSVNYCVLYLLVNISKTVPNIMSKIPDDTATQDIDHLAFRWQQHFAEASLVTACGRPVGGRITKGEDTESWLLNTLLSESVIVLSSSGTMVDTVEGTERISIPCSGSAMIRLNLGGCEDERPFSSLEGLKRKWATSEHRGKASAQPTIAPLHIEGVKLRNRTSFPSYLPILNYNYEDAKIGDTYI